MFSSLIPDILKPVSIMCGLSKTPESNSTHQGYTTTPPSTAAHVPANKPVSRCISHSSASASTDDSHSASSDSHSDEEICNRMANLGREAKKAGRHVLVGDKLILS